MKMNKEKPSYLPKVALVRLHTAGKEVNDYRQELERKRRKGNAGNGDCPCRVERRRQERWKRA